MNRSMKKDGLKKLKYAFRIIFTLSLLAFVFYIIFKSAPEILQLLKKGDEAELQAYLEEAGKSGIIILILLQILQTITIVFPGIPIYMCAGIVFGNLKGTLICYLTYVISNAIIFLVSRRMGEAADELFPNKKELAVEEMLKNTKHPKMLVGALCMLPAIPNGIIPHLAAKSNIKFKEFVFAVAIGCAPGIFLFVFCGQLILLGQYWVLPALIIVGGIIGIVFFINKKKIMEFVNKTLGSKNVRE